MRTAGMVLLTVLLVAVASPSVIAGGMEVPRPGTAGGVGISEGGVNLSGYVDAAYVDPDTGESTFEVYNVDVILSGSVADNTLYEVNVESRDGLDTLGVADQDEFNIRYAYIDYICSDAVIVRAGKFLTPFGVFNEYLSPSPVNKLISDPITHGVPVSVQLGLSGDTDLAETGVQLRGVVDTGGMLGVNYAVYISNGTTTDLESGDDDKAFGGRIGLAGPVDGLEYGFSYYTSDEIAGTVVDWTKFGVDVAYCVDALDIRGEYVDEEWDAADIDETAFYVQAAYQFLENMEGVVRYDTLDKADYDRTSLGVNILANDNLTLKINYELADLGNVDMDTFGAQLALSF